MPDLNAPGAVKFQSTPSVWRVTCANICKGCCKSRFQSTPSVWRVTAKVYKQNINQFLFLSIKNKILTFVEKTNVNIYSCIL